MELQKLKIGIRTSEYRIKREVSTKELAELSGISLSSLNNVTKATGSVPSLETLNAIASALNVTIDMLLQDSLRVYCDVDLDSKFDEDLVKVFYGLDTSRKEFVLNFIGKLKLYKKLNDSTKVAEISHEQPSFGCKEELISELQYLSEDIQYAALELIKKINKILANRN